MKRSPTIQARRDGAIVHTPYREHAALNERP